MRKLRLILSITALMAMTLGVLAPAPAHASGPGNGSLVFNGTANLPRFPCTTSCNGLFNGRVRGALQGTNAGNKGWQLVFNGSKMHADYSYQEPRSTCPESGTAAGNITISGGDILYGKYNNKVVSKADSTATFTWTRVGNSAVVSVVLSLTLTTPVGSFQVLSGAHLTSVAAFAVNGVPDCAHPGPVKATVAGVAALNQVTG